MVNQKTSPKSLILARLRSAQGPVSGTELAALIGASRVAAWKHLEALREAGYDLVADHGGYALASEGDFLHPWEFPGREDRVRRYLRTDSTMDRALELALSEPDSGAIVVAESQVRGRGRRGKKWSSPRGGLFATLAVTKRPSPWRADRLSMAGGLALCQALRETTGEPFTISWPNDILLEGRKAAGILVEYLVEGDGMRLALLGLGVNVKNHAPGPGAFSLAELPGPHATRRDLLAAFLDRFESLDPEEPGLRETYEGLSSIEGTPVLSRDEGRPLGRALGVDEEARLVVAGADGKTAKYRPDAARLAKKEQL